jgi:hypothetical protein
MNRQLQAPLTLPKHNKLLEEINQTIVDIKFHDDEHPMMIDKDLLIEMRAKHKKHSLVEIVNLLQRCYKAINEQREDPRKY